MWLCEDDRKDLMTCSHSIENTFVNRKYGENVHTNMQSDANENRKCIKPQEPVRVIHTVPRLKVLLFSKTGYIKSVQPFVYFHLGSIL